MKLVLAIVHDAESGALMEALNKEGYFVTKLASTGGFLKAGNTTLMIGINDEKVENVIDVIRDKCGSRERMIINPPIVGSLEAGANPFPIEIDVGGATVFVLDIDRFEKI